MATVPKNSRKGAKISGAVTRTVKSFTFATAKGLPLIWNNSEVRRLNSGFSMTEFQVNTTSSAENGLPSLHRTPCRNLHVQVRLSGATAHDSASAGAGS